MSTFGHDFGASAFGGAPYGVDAASVIERMLSRLDPFRRTATSGVLETLDVFSGPVEEPEVLERIMQGGAPAMFVGYQGSSFANGSTDGLLFNHEQRYAVVCVASSWRDRTERLDGGRNVYQPGLWNMTRWAAHFAGLALRDVFGGQARPTAERLVGYTGTSFIGIVEFEATGTFHWQDPAELLNRLKRLGVVHTPRDPSQLFEDDNTTPNTLDPTSPPSGVAELGS